MDFIDHNANKENMARFLESEPSPSTACAGIANTRMLAMREQQLQDILLNQETSPASNGEQSMDVDMDMDECSALPPIQQNNRRYSFGNNVLPRRNDVNQRRSKSAQELDRWEEKMDCSSNDDMLPDTNDVNGRVKQYSNFAERLDKDEIYTFYVIDTCVYIDALEGIKELLTFCLDKNNHSVLVVPYQVLSELDYLKGTKPYLAARVDAAVRFIRINLDKKHCAMKAQHLNDFNRRYAKHFSGDDSILDCAMQLREQVPNAGTITMVTHDGVLRAKAAAAQLGERTMKSLLGSLLY